jgi:hypothetical protein
MDPRIFVSCKTNESNLAVLPRRKERCVRSIGIQNAVGIFKPDNFVMLNQIDTFNPETPQRFIQLPRSFLSRTPVDFGHEKSLFAISVTQCFAHADFAGAIVVVPGVVEEVDSSVQRTSYDPNSQIFIDIFHSEVPSTNSNG